MFRKRTLFVVGAGASHEFGLPVGNQLAKTISIMMDVRSDRHETTGKGDQDLFYSVLRTNQKNTHSFQNAFWMIRDGILLCNSIDDFLDIHRDNNHVNFSGKSAIVRSIVAAERSSKLFFDKSNIYNRMNMLKVEETWLISFFRVLSRGLPLSDVDNLFQNVAFIVFNYDRCIEQFLAHAIQQLYSLPSSKAHEILSQLTIIHPYGTVGELAIEHGRHGVFFGGAPEKLQEDYPALSKEIKTYTEQLEEGEELERIRNEVDKAENIVFLGFAFHDQNMRIIKPREPIKRKNIYATAYGMSDSDVEIVRSQFLEFFEGQERFIMDGQNHIHIRNDLTCAKLFEQYSKSLPA